MKKTMPIAPCVVILFFLFLLKILAVQSKSQLSLGTENSAGEPKLVESLPRWPACDDTARIQKLSFVHVADAHAHYNPDREGSSPLARVRGFYERTRKENPFTVFTNAGDDYEKGSIAEALSHGRATRQVVQAMRYDVRTLGNHDFAWGLQELLAYSRDPAAIVLASNSRLVETSPGTQAFGTPGWTNYAELTVGCVRVGFFALVTRPWNEKDEPYEGPYYPDLPHLETDFHFVAAARQVIARHRQDVDLLVLVSHLGIEEDIRVAEQTEGIDVILGGHSHATLDTPLAVKDTSIVHVGGNAEHIGRLDVEYDLLERRILACHFELVPNVEQKAPADLATAVSIEGILAPYREELTREFSRVRAPQGREAMARIAARAAVETLGVDAALVGAHTVWREWQPGGLTQQDVLDAFVVEREPAGQPGFSSLYRLKVTGANLLLARDSLAHFAYWGPQRVDASAVYTIAIQKPQAFHQQEHFGREIGVSPPEPATELWEAVVALGRARSAEGLSLDEAYPAAGGRQLIALRSPEGAVR